MNQKVVYSIMALSVVPGAAVQAAVGVQTGTAIISTNNKVEVNFGTLVPGKYLFTGVVTQGSVTSATFGDVQANISGATISATLVLTEATNVTFVANGNSQFTLGAYELKLDWEPDATALNALYEQVYNNIQGYNPNLTAAHQQSLASSLQAAKAKIEDIEALADDAAKYDAYKNYKLYNEKDDITLELEGIQATAEQNFIDDCWAARMDAYNAVVAQVSGTNGINATAISPLETAIAQIPEAFTVPAGITLPEGVVIPDTPRAKRSTALQTIKDELEAFLEAAETQLGDKPTNVDDATPNFDDFDPDPSLATIQTQIQTLQGYVQKDAQNLAKVAAFKTAVETTANALAAVNAKIAAQKNVADKAANEATASGITNDLKDALTTALATYGALADGADFQAPSLEAINTAIATLSQTVDAQDAAYEATNTTIEGYFTAALDNYETQLAAVTQAITETAYVDILEGAQSDLLAKKNELTALQATYTTAYQNGGNLNAATAQGEVDAINQAMETIATEAIAEAAGYRAIYEAFAAQIADQKARLTAITETDGYNDVADILGDQINAQNELLEEIEANLTLANKANAQGVHEIGTPGYAPTAYDGTTTIATVTAAIDDMNVDQIIAELNAYTTAMADIQDVRDGIANAKTNVTSYGSSQGVINKGYDVGAAWDAAVSDLADQLDVLEATITEKYGDGTTTQVQDYAATLATELGEINTAVNNFKADARSAIQKYKDFYNNIWGISNTNPTTKRLQSLTSRVQGKAVYDDVTYIFNNVTGDNKANFQTRIAEIQSTIDQAENDRVAALELTGNDHYTAVKALNYSNYKIAKVIVELPDGTKPVNLTNQSLNNACDKLTSDVITQAQNAYDEAVAEMVVDAIAATFTDAQAAVKEAITASKAEKTEGVDLGVAAQGIINAYDALFDTADGLGLSASDNTAIKKVRKYNELLTQIGHPNNADGAATGLYAQLQTLEGQADLAVMLVESLDELADERADAETYVTTNCPDVPNSYDFGVIDADIQALVDNIETAANAAAGPQLVANQAVFSDEIGRISELIAAEQAKAVKAQAKYTANVNLTAKYNEVNSYLGEQRALVGAVAGNAPDEFDQAAIQTYKDEFNGEGGFVEQLAAIKAEMKAKLESDAEADTYYEDLLAQLDALKTEIGEVLPAAQANYASYQTQMEAYNASLEVYNENNATLNDATVYPEQGSAVIVQAKDDMAAQKAELDAALENIQNQYGAGEAVDNESTNIATVGAIATAIEEIISTLDGGTYAQAISAQNAQTYSDDILPALQTIQDAYVAAVAVLDDYQGAQNADIRALVEQESADLNNAVFEAPQTKSNFAARATQEQNAANAAGTLWNTAQILSDIEAYVNELNQTKADFANAIEGTIVNYWNGQKTTRQNYINSIFNTLTARGYNAGAEPQTAEEIFANQYSWIAQGDAIVNPEGEDAIISIAALDNLLATDGFSTATYQNNIKATACALANTEVMAMLDPYINATTGKKVTDLAEINEIIADGYDLPDGETTIEDQFNNLVYYLTWADNQRVNRLSNGTLYTYNKSNFQTRLTWYDNGVEQLKATATEWAQNRADRLDAIATLTDNCVTATATIDAAVDLINQTSVAANYEDAIAAIYALVAEPDNDWTMADVQEAEANLAQVDGALATLNDNVVAAVLEIANTKIAGLKADFNQYAAGESADEDVVNDLSNRIHTVEATIANGTDIDGAIALELEVAKLQTELEILNNAQFTADIEEYENRAADLQAATLPEADYGNKADEFAERLAAINAAGEAIGADITAHVAAGDIMPYVASIVSRLEEQEAALEALEADAEAQAQKVEANKLIVAALNERVNALLAAELTGEYGPYANYVAQRLANIQNQATILAGNIETNAANIDLYQVQYDNRLTHLEGQLEQLQEDAAGYAEEWAAQQATNAAVYAVLLEQFNAINAEIQGYIDAAAAFSNGSTGALTNSKNQLAGVKNGFDAENEDYTLDEDDQANYIDQMEQIQRWAQNEMNYMAFIEARALYTLLYNNDLKTAKNDAWTAWNNWSFAAIVKATLQQQLNGYDTEVQTLVNLISSDYAAGNSYANMAAYAETAAAIIAEYNAIVGRMANFKPFGDATGDGKVNVLDYQKVANMILDPTLVAALSEDAFLVTDVNQNEAIEVGDLTGIVNIIMGREWDQAAARGMNVTDESLTMTTSQTQVGTQRIAISLQNVNEYTAFQLDVVLPDGMKIVGKNLTDRAGDSHNLWSRNQMDGSVRFLASSIKGETFKGNSGAVFYIDVETTSDYVGGEVELVNVLFSDVTSATRSFAVGSEATGIETVGVVDSLKQQVYNLGGKLMDGLKKGVNIIRRADGKTQKVVK